MSDFPADLPWWGWLILLAVLTPLILGYRLKAKRNAEFARTAERAGFTWVERDDDERGVQPGPPCRRPIGASPVTSCRPG